MGSLFINCIRGYAKCDVGTGWPPLKKLCIRSGSVGGSNYFISIYIIKLGGVKLFFFGFDKRWPTTISCGQAEFGWTAGNCFYRRFFVVTKPVVSPSVLLKF
jgi:hypothetical protein